MRHLSWIAGAGAVAFVFVAGVLTGASLPLAQAKDEAYAKLDVFARVLNIVQTQYVDPVKEDKLIYGAIQGMLDTLDPHSLFMTPDVYREMKVETTGEFMGVGVVVETRERRLSLVEVMPNTPADRAGLQPGDILTQIDGRDTLDMPLDQAVTLMRGAPGSSLGLAFMRPGFAAARTVTLARERVRMLSVESRLLAERIGYLRIKQFQDRTAQETIHALESLDKGAKGRLAGLVIDLRGNPGGLLDEAVRVADEFLDDGLIVTTEGRQGAGRDEERAHRGGHDPKGPVVLLIDGGSASAAEILAGALKDQHRATLIGTRSYGKGSVQNIIDLEDGSGLKLTVARYFTPSGVCIDGKGINPDIVVVEPMNAGEHAARYTEEDYEPAPHDPGLPQPPAPVTSVEGLRLLAAVPVPEGVDESDHPLRAAFAFLKLGGLPKP